MLISVNSGIKETHRHILFAGNNFVGDRIMYVTALWEVVKAVGRGEGSGNKHLLSSFNVPGAMSRALLSS